MGREPPDLPLPCPRCTSAQLTHTPNDPEEYGHHCASCGGLFVAADDWTRLLTASTTTEVEIIDTTGAAPLSSSQLFPMAACPACRSMMERATFAARSGISVDVCNMHGIWFDAGELFQTVRWLSEGRHLVEPLNRVVELRMPRAGDRPGENGNDIYARLAAGGNLLTLRRLFPWR